MSEVLNVGGGANPVGTIISFFGPSAPDGYLACDGTTYNRADYPELADHLVSNFSDLVGDGATTFKVPDLRGEFLRGTGTNSHANQGNGRDVGVHQDATQHQHSYNNSNMFWAQNTISIPNTDSTFGSATEYKIGGTKNNSQVAWYTSRPTNTSVLYCIKY